MYNKISDFLSFSGEMKTFIIRGLMTSICGGIGLISSNLLFKVGSPITDGLAIVLGVFTIIMYFWAQMAMFVRKCEVIWPAAIITILAVAIALTFCLRLHGIIDPELSWIILAITYCVSLLLALVVTFY